MRGLGTTLERRARGAAVTIAAGLVAMLLAAAPAAAVDLGQKAYSLDGDQLVSFDLRTPNSATTTALTGINVNDDLVALAVRPQTNGLYALGVDAINQTMTLYLVTPRSNIATPVGTAFQFVDSSGSTVVPPTGTNWGMAFNPVTDRVRVVNDTGKNFRVNPNTGAPVDGNLGGGAATGTNMDGAINGPVGGVDATAYARPNANASATTQYTLAAATDTLYVQNPPNSGTETVPVPLVQSGSPYDASSAKGLALLPGTQPGASNQPVTGSAYAVLRTGSSTRLATVDLTSGEVTDIGAIGAGGSGIHGLAVLAEHAPGARPLIMLQGSNIVRTDLASLGTTTSVATTGITAGETLIAIARRPATGQILGLGVDSSASTATLYIVDPQTGALTPIGAPSSVAFEHANGSGYFLTASGYGMSVSPTADRVRIVNYTGLTFRINPNTGAPVDGDLASANTNPDAIVNGLPGGASDGILAASYTDSFAGATKTTLYTLHLPSHSLYIQTPPNLGTQTSPVSVTLNGAAMAIDFGSSLDIPSEVSAPAANSPATGAAYAVLGLSNASLFSIDLATGAATNRGLVGVGATTTGLVVGELAPAFTALPVPTPEPTPTPTPNPTVAPEPPTAPVLRTLTARDKKLRTGKRPTGASKKIPTGTVLNLDLTQASTITITIERLTAGKQSKGKCVTPTTKLRKAKSCTRSTAAGTLTQPAPAGKSTVAFTGKVRGKALKLGDYRLTVQAKNAAGLSSTSATVKLSVVR